MDKSDSSEEFKRDAVRQITKPGHPVPVPEVSLQLGGSQHSRYEWKKKFAASNAKNNVGSEKIRRLKTELAHVIEERDIQKMRPRISPGMQSEVRVHPNRFYAWLRKPLSRQASKDKRQTAFSRRLGRIAARAMPIESSTTIFSIRVRCTVLTGSQV